MSEDLVSHVSVRDLTNKPLSQAHKWVKNRKTPLYVCREKNGYKYEKVITISVWGADYWVTTDDDPYGFCEGHKYLVYKAHNAKQQQEIEQERSHEECSNG
jgi:hypothetical protein